MTDHIIAAICHWLNGDAAAAWDEGFCVESAVIADGRIKVVLSQSESETQVYAMFALMEISLPAKIRQKDGSIAGQDAPSADAS